MTRAGTLQRRRPRGTTSRPYPSRASARRRAEARPCLAGAHINIHLARMKGRGPWGNHGFPHVKAAMRSCNVEFGTRIAAGTEFDCRGVPSASGDGEERFDARRIELPAGLGADLLEGSGPRPGLAVRPRLDHCLESICDCDDPRRQRDLLRPLSIRVAAPVPALMVRPHDAEDVRKVEYSGDETLPQGGVATQQRQFKLVQAPGLRENPIRNEHFADVMKKRPELNLATLVATEAQLGCDCERKPADSRGVLAGVAVLELQTIDELRQMPIDLVLLEDIDLAQLLDDGIHPSSPEFGG